MSTCISGDGCLETAIESHSFPKVHWFCETHQAQLDAVKGTMGDQAWQKKLRDEGTEPVERVCAEPNCTERPVYGSDICADCAATAGY